MTVSSNLWGDEWDSPPQRHVARHRMLSRRQARRMSRSFAGVGVGIPATRLLEIAGGAPLVSDEYVDVNFALAAMEIERQQRHAKVTRGRRSAVQWLIVAGLVLASMNLLMCMAYVFISLVLHESAL